MVTPYFSCGGVGGDYYAACDLPAFSINTNRGEESKTERYASTKFDVAIAMTIAGFVNLAMMATAAAAFISMVMRTLLKSKRLI